MIVNFNEPAGASASESGTRSAWAQRYEALRGSLVERVCSFLEQYPTLHSEDEDVARPVALSRNRDHRGPRQA